MKDLTTIINGKRYVVTKVFNMVANYEFTDKHNAIHLVDAEDVSNWANHQEKEPTDGIISAIAYAKELARESEDGVFWWKIK